MRSEGDRARIPDLNLGIFIVLWTSTIILLIFITLLLVFVSQMNKETIKINKKVKLLIDALSEKKIKLGEDDI